jgi:hypothetical protein
MTEGWTSNNAINLDDVSEDPPGPLANGLYRFTVAEADADSTKKGGAGVKVVLEVSGGFSDESTDKCYLNLYDKITFSPKALFRLKQICRATGVEPPQTDTFGDVVEFAERLVGMTGIVRTKREKYIDRNGEERESARIDRYLSEEQALVASNPAAKANDSADEAPARGRRRKAA